MERLSDSEIERLKDKKFWKRGISFISTAQAQGQHPGHASWNPARREPPQPARRREARQAPVRKPPVVPWPRIAEVHTLAVIKHGVLLISFVQ